MNTNNSNKLHATQSQIIFSWGCNHQMMPCTLQLKHQHSPVSCNYCYWENNVHHFYVCNTHKTIICMQCCKNEINEHKKSERKSELQNDYDSEYSQSIHGHKMHSNKRKRGRLSVDKNKNESSGEPNKKRRKLDDTCMQMNKLVKKLVLQQEKDYNSKIKQLQKMQQKAVNTATKQVEELRRELMENESYILRLKETIENLGVQCETLQVKNQNELDEAANKLRIVSNMKQELQLNYNYVVQKYKSVMLKKDQQLVKVENERTQCIDMYENEVKKWKIENT
eukprot:810950_1